MGGMSSTRAPFGNDTGKTERYRAFWNRSAVARPLVGFTRVGWFPLQEFAAAESMPAPVYEVVDEQGPVHTPIFTVKVSVAELEAEGVGPTKRKAGQRAARGVLERVEGSVAAGPEEQDDDGEQGP